MIYKNFLTAVDKLNSDLIKAGDFVFIEPYLKKANSVYGQAFTPLGQKNFLKALLTRQKLLNYETLIEYLSVLRLRDFEWLNLWPYAIDGESIFFRNYTQFEVAKELVSEWSVMASERSLKVLVVGCDNGAEVYSLAIMLEEIGLRAKGWQLEFYVVDLNKEGVEKAQKALFTETDLEWLSEHLKRKWFNVSGAFWRFKENLVEDINFAVHNIYDTQNWPWPEKDNNFNLIFCRGLAWSASNTTYTQLADVLKNLAASSAFIFTDNGEVLQSTDKNLELEERAGVLYYRIGERRAKVQKTKIKANEEDEQQLNGDLTLSPDLGLRGENLYNLAAEKILKSDDLLEVELSRELVWELINNLQEQSLALPEAWALLAASAFKLGQSALGETLAKLILAFQNNSPLAYFLLAKAETDEKEKAKLLEKANNYALKTNKHWSSAYYEDFKNFTF